MKDEIQSMCLTPDIVKQFNTLLNTHCQSSEEALGMLSALCFELMMKCGVQSITASWSTVWAYPCNSRGLILPKGQARIFTNLNRV